MKKFYSTMALASLMVATASAASPMVEMQKVQENMVQSVMKSEQVITGATPTRAGETRALSSVQDVCKVYNVSEQWWYPLNGDPRVTPSFVISQIDGNMVGISCNGAPFANPILATVDVANSTLTIKADDNTNLYSDAQYGSLNLELMEIIFDEEGGGTPQATSSLTCEILADGRINFISGVLMWGWASGGYQFGVGNFLMEPLEYFSFNASDWREVGTAKYDDGLFNPALESPIEAVDVPVMASTTTQGLYLLKNPYSQGVWPQVFDKVVDGYILFNISNPDCVTVSPLVGTGAMLDYGEAGGPQQLEEFFFYNNEGLKLMNGTSTETQVEEVEEAMDPFNETIADYLSSYDAATRTVNIRNGMFGQSSDPLAGYVWKATDQNTGLMCTIVLPEDSGIEDIISNSNAPVKYFNLQGMEVANPEAGQIVIKKQGSKTFKVIAE